MLAGKCLKSSDRKSLSSKNSTPGQIVNQTLGYYIDIFIYPKTKKYASYASFLHAFTKQGVKQKRGRHRMLEIGDPTREEAARGPKITGLLQA